MNKLKTLDLRDKESELYKLKQQAIQMAVNVTFSDEQKSCQYEKSLLHTLVHGIPKFDRTGTDTIGIHGYQSRFNLDDGFPLITTKKLHLKSVIYELLWFLKGDTNIKYLNDNGVKIWDEWADENGNLGPVYGKQWMDWSAHKIQGHYELQNPADRECSPDVFVFDGCEIISINQIDQIVALINKQHETGVISRRMIVSAWNVADVPKMKLSPCHCLFQFHSRLMTFDERKAY